MPHSTTDNGWVWGLVFLLWILVVILSFINGNTNWWIIGGVILLTIILICSAGEHFCNRHRYIAPNGEYIMSSDAGRGGGAPSKPVNNVPARQTPVSASPSNGTTAKTSVLTTDTTKPFNHSQLLPTQFQMHHPYHQRVAA